MNTIKVAILANCPLFADALSVSPNGQAGIEVVNTFDDGLSVLAYLEKQPVDVLLVDHEGLPPTLCMEVVRSIKKRRLKTKCVILIDDDDDVTILTALHAGVSGYVQKKADVSIMILAIRDVHGGGFPMNSKVARKIIDEPSATGKQHLLSEELSQRENEILQLLSAGYRYKEIADLLFISVETVRTHIRNMYEKLHVNCRAEAIKKVKDRMNGIL